MDNLTDFENNEDVSDAAIRYAADLVDWDETVSEIRVCDFKIEEAILVIARLIQRHHPELLVDPVDVIVSEVWARETDECIPRGSRHHTAAKRLYLLGIEKGKQS